MQNTSNDNKLRFLYNRIQEKLWVKPLIFCLLSLFAIFVAGIASLLPVSSAFPKISSETLSSLLTVMASSMMVIATLAVSSMVAAYSSASNTASPRTFDLVLADGVSQKALSTFIAAFIFSIFGLLATLEEYLDVEGRFVLFAETILVFTLVILMFVHWVDHIARLGRMGNILQKVESATASALRHWSEAPGLEGVPVQSINTEGSAVYSPKVAYLQHVDIAALQEIAEKIEATIAVAVLPGSLLNPTQPLVFVRCQSGQPDADCQHEIRQAFVTGKQRSFDDDPRFGLVVLSQIAARAQSPAVNDPGTAIDVISIVLRLLLEWQADLDKLNEQEKSCRCNRVEVPGIKVNELLEDAFSGIIRHGASNVEVLTRLLKAFAVLHQLDNSALQEAVRVQTRLLLNHASQAGLLDDELKTLQSRADFADQHD